MSQNYFTLGLPLKTPADANTLAEQLLPLMPAMFKAQDSLATIHSSRSTVLSEEASDAVYFDVTGCTPDSQLLGSIHRARWQGEVASKKARMPAPEPTSKAIGSAHREY